MEISIAIITSISNMPVWPIYQYDSVGIKGMKRVVEDESANYQDLILLPGDSSG